MDDLCSMPLRALRERVRVLEEENEELKDSLDRACTALLDYFERSQTPPA